MNSKFQLIPDRIKYFQMVGEEEQNIIVIGYFGLRAKAQVPRLLCQHLGIRYRDQIFTQQEWQKFKQNEAKDWFIKAIPFLKHNSFVITGENAMKEYLILHSKNQHLLGNCLKDQIFINKYKVKYDLKDDIISLICSNSTKENKPLHQPEYYWKNVINPRLKQLQQNAQENNWYLGYLTILDFNIYELMNYLTRIFPNLDKIYFKLLKLKDRVKALKAIDQYQKSTRAIKIYNPIHLIMKKQIKSQNTEHQAK